jgi:MinD superfamily P-loop ATPase
MVEVSEFALSVLSQIKVGKENARSGKVLATLLNEKDTRRIRLAIIELIEFHNDVIIGDANYGYYIAENTDQGAEACKRLMRTLKSLGHHHQVLQKAVFKKLSGQLTLVK